MTGPAPTAPTTPRLEVVVGDITAETVDAIVNAANSALQRGGGVDNAIHAAAGSALQPALDQLGGCPTGDCRITPGFNLKARYIIHCVGPIWHGGTGGEDDALAACYTRAIALARDQGVRSIAFPAISTGVYGFPRDRAARIAVAAVRAAHGPGGPDLVRFVCFDDASANAYRTVLDRAGDQPG